MADEPLPGPVESGPILCEGRRLGQHRFEVAEGIWRIPIPTGYSAGDVNLYWMDVRTNAELRARTFVRR